MKHLLVLVAAAMVAACGGITYSTTGTTTALSTTTTAVVPLEPMTFAGEGSRALDSVAIPAGMWRVTVDGYVSVSAESDSGGYWVRFNSVHCETEDDCTSEGWIEFSGSTWYITVGGESHGKNYPWRLRFDPAL